MPRSIQITETSPLLHDANCVYCHVDLELGDHAVVCDSCRSPHHADCWQVNGSRCATFGCDVAAIATSNSGLQAEQRTSAQPYTIAMPNWIIGFMYFAAVAFIFLFGRRIFSMLNWEPEGFAFMLLLFLSLVMPLIGMIWAIPKLDRFFSSLIRSLFNR